MISMPSLISNFNKSINDSKKKKKKKKKEKEKKSILVKSLTKIMKMIG